MAKLLSGTRIYGTATVDTQMFVSGSTTATSTITGALQVVGGVGVGGVIVATEHHTPTGLANKPSNLYDISGNYIHAQNALNIGRASGGNISFGEGNTPAIILATPGSSGSIRAYLNNDASNNQLWYGNSTGLLIGNGTSPTAKLDVRGNATITSTATSTSTTTGALQVVGGVGIGGKLYVGGLANNTSSYIVYYNTATGELGYGANAGGGGGISSPYSGIFTITNTTAASSTTTGALQVVGGVGVGGSLWASGVIRSEGFSGGFFSQAGATIGYAVSGDIISVGSSGTGAGYGVLGATSNIFGLYSTANTVDVALYTNRVITSGIKVLGSTGDVIVQNTTTASSTSTGALQVRGGVGVGGDIYAGGGITATNLTLSNSSNSITIPNGGKIRFHTSSPSIIYGDFTQLTFQPGNAGSAVTMKPSGTAATSTTTGALQVVGGVGIGGDLYVSGTINGSVTGAVIGTASTATNIAGGLSGQLHYQTGPGATSFVSTGTAGQVLVSGGTGSPVYQSTLTLAGTTAASSTITGAFQVVGGAGIGGKLYVGGLANNTSSYIVYYNTATGELGYGANAGGGGVGSPYSGIFTITNTTAASSTITGALQVVGGVGIGGNLYAGGTGTFNGPLTVNQIYTGYNGINVTGSIANNGVSMKVLNTDANAGSFALLSVQSGNGSFLPTLSLTAGYSPNSTAIEVSYSDFYIRGAQTDKDIYIATNYNQNAIKVTGTDKTVRIYSTVSSTSTATGALQIVGGVGVGGGLFVGGTVTATLHVGNLTGTATTATNIAGGALGSIPYQTAAGTTAFIPIGTNGYILTAGASTATWSAVSSLSAGNATTSTNIAGGAANQIPYQSAAGATTFSSNLTWNGTTLYVNGRLQNAGGLKTYSVSTGGQGNTNAVYEIMKISRDNLNWSNNTPYEITVYSSYYTSGGCTKWLLSYGYYEAGTLTCTYAGGSGALRVYLGTEVTVNANLQYRPVFVDLPPYMQASIEVRYSTTEVGSVGAITASGQVFFSNIMTASGGTGSFYSGGITYSGSLTAGTIISKIAQDYVVSVTANSATTTIDLSQGNTFYVTMSATTTIAFSNVPTGSNLTNFSIITYNSAAGYAISWPASVTWAGGQTPARTTTSGKSDIYTFFTLNAGTNIIGSLSILNY